MSSMPFADAAWNWQLRFHQLDRGRFLGEMERIVGGRVMVLRCHFNRKLQQLGSSPPGCRSFGVPLRDHTPHSWRRHEVGSNNLSTWKDDVEMDCISSAGFHIYAVSIAEELLAEAAQGLGFESHEEILGREQVVRCPGSHLEELRRVCGLVVGQGSFGYAFGDALQCELPSLMLQGFLSADRKLPVPISLVRRRALRLAMEAIREPGETIVRVKDLCRLTGVGERTLRYAFTESFGVSPKSYLQSRRLNAARRELRLGGGAP